MTWPTPVADRLGRRIGNWVYVHGCGWQFTGTNVVIDKNAGRDEGWYLTTASGYVELDGIRSLACQRIDPYLDATMRWIEQHLIHYINAAKGQTCGNCGLVHAPWPPLSALPAGKSCTAPAPSASANGPAIARSAPNADTLASSTTCE